MTCSSLVCVPSTSLYPSLSLLLCIVWHFVHHPFILPSLFSRIFQLGYYHSFFKCHLSIFAPCFMFSSLYSQYSGEDNRKKWNQTPRSSAVFLKYSIDTKSKLKGIVEYNSRQYDDVLAFHLICSFSSPTCSIWISLTVCIRWYNFLGHLFVRDLAFTTIGQIVLAGT